MVLEIIDYLKYIRTTNTALCKKAKNPEIVRASIQAPPFFTIQNYMYLIFKSA